MELNRKEAQQLVLTAVATLLLIILLTTIGSSNSNNLCHCATSLSTEDSATLKTNVKWAKQFPSSPPSDATSTNVSSFKIMVDSDNNTYVCGGFSGDSVPFGNIIAPDGRQHVQTALVVIMDTHGNVSRVITVQSTGDAFCEGLVLVSDGLYFSGTFTGDLEGDFASQFTRDQLHHVRDNRTVRAYIVKYSLNGNVVSDSLQILGSESSFTEVVALGADANDTLYLIGNFDGEVTFNSLSTADGDRTTLSATGTLDSFFARFSNSDGTYDGIQHFGGDRSTSIFGIATNVHGDSCTIGYSTGTSTVGNQTYTLRANETAIHMQRINSTGGQVWFDKVVTRSASAYGVSIDDGGACSFAATVYSYYERANGSRVELNTTLGSFFTRYRANGINPVFVTSEGTTTFDLSCNTDSGGGSSSSSLSSGETRCYTTGYFDREIIAGGATYQHSNSTVQYFVAEYDGDGNFLGLLLPSNNSNISQQQSRSEGESLTFRNGNLWVTGLFYSSNFTVGTSTLTLLASVNMFVIRYE